MLVVCWGKVGLIELVVGIDGPFELVLTARMGVMVSFPFYKRSLGRSTQPVGNLVAWLWQWFAWLQINLPPLLSLLLLGTDRVCSSTERMELA